MAKLKVPVNDKDHIRGNPKARITLVEYGDYECPHCGKAHEVVKHIQNHFEEQLRFVFRNFPLSNMHPYAEIAAETAEFAGVHGKFWEMHDLLFEQQENLNVPFLSEATGILNLPVKELESSIEKRIFAERVREDFIGGVKSGVNGTPTFFINDERYNGPYDYANLINAIEQKLGHKVS